MASVESLRRYYEREASPWERQVLLKARPCAGDPFLGRRVLEEFSEVLCGSSPPSRDELLAMRLRIERERAEVGREGELHLKLGPGGMMDIEFLVQYLQMECWAVCSGVRTTRTLDVIRSLTESGRLPRQEGEALFRAYTVLKGLENRLGLILDHRGTDEPCSIQDLEALEPLEDLPWVPTRLRKGGLVQGLRHLLDEVRSIFLRHMEGGASSLR
jgi:glutamate-ammonia-ligase adenylyltransferase